MLQPFLMGRFVSVHPLGVIIAIALGVIVAGIPGALIAVPLAASLNAVVQHLANYTEVGEDAEEPPRTTPPAEDVGRGRRRRHDEDDPSTSRQLNPAVGPVVNAVLATLSASYSHVQRPNSALHASPTPDRSLGPRAPRVAP